MNMPWSASSSGGAGMTQEEQEEEAGGFDIQPQERGYHGGAGDRLCRGKCLFCLLLYPWR